MYVIISYLNEYAACISKNLSAQIQALFKIRKP